MTPAHETVATDTRGKRCCWVSVGHPVYRVLRHRMAVLVRAWAKRWGRRRQAFLDEWVTGRDVLFAVPTRSRADVGRWFRMGRMWIVCRPGEIVLCAYGPRPLVESWPVTDLKESFYNAITGDLVLIPSSEAVRRRLRVSPLEAYRILEYIRNGMSPSALTNGEPEDPKLQGKSD